MRAIKPPLDLENIVFHDLSTLKKISHRISRYISITAAFIVLVDSTIVNVALPHIALSFHATQEELEWVINAYTLTFSAIMLGAGAFSDAIEAKKIFILGMLIFVLSSVTCASAKSIMYLNIARCIQGIGAALILPSALVLATGLVKKMSKNGRKLSVYEQQQEA